MKSVMYQDREILESLYDFMNAVKKKNPVLLFTVSSSPRMVRNVRDEMGELKSYATSIEVFTDEDSHKSIGSIGIDHNEEYCVTSRLIENNKYSVWSGSSHNTKKSKHMNVAVKTATKFLKPVSANEVFNEYHDKFFKQLKAKKSKLNSGLESLLGGIGTTARLTEIKNMMELGYTPKTPEFKKVVEYIRDNQAEMEAQANYNPPYTMVRIKDNGEAEYCSGDGVAQKEFITVPKVPSKDKLPEEILGKMAVLDITEVGTFIEDVGVRSALNVYWVIQ